MASDPSTAAVHAYVLSRMALWAGDVSSAQDYVDEFEKLLASSGKPSFRDAKSLEEILAANVAFMSSELPQRDKNQILIGDERSDARIESKSLRGMITTDGFGRFFLRAYLHDISKEGKFFENVDKRAFAGTEIEAGDKVERGRSTKAELLRLRGHQWLDKSESPSLLVQVGEFALITAMGQWCPLPASEQARRRFLILLKDLDVTG